MYSSDVLLLDQQVYEFFPSSWKKKTLLFLCQNNEDGKLRDGKRRRQTTRIRNNSQIVRTLGKTSVQQKGNKPEWEKTEMRKNKDRYKGRSDTTKTNQHCSPSGEPEA